MEDIQSSMEMPSMQHLGNAFDMAQLQPPLAPSDSSSIEGDEEEGIDPAIFLLMGMAIQAYFIMLAAFQPNEICRENQITVNPRRPVDDLLSKYSQTPQLFKDLTNFTLEEFAELCQLVCPTIANHARSTGINHRLRGRPTKLTPEQRLLSFIFYMKHDNTIYFDAAHWNWARLAVCDDALFVASCVNDAIANEIRWPSAEERRELGSVIPNLPGCIGFVDGTLCKIRRPFQDPLHGKWYQGRKKIYCFNSTVLVDHHGLFIYIDPGYPGSFHDVTILKDSWVDKNWQNLFANDEANNSGYYEYVLGDQGYTSMENYVMRGFSKVEIRAMQLDEGLVKVFNKMHAGYRVKVEWGIGGMKQKFRRLQKRFDLVRSKFTITFTAAALLTNFLHRRRRDMRVEIVGPRVAGEENRGWAGDW